ncbi:MAG: alanine--tRNA ligase [Endomicrobium sp.]|jgi:alanyl-tRNA synthetase|nr:alanine--tRNA ligase [Endomicrobium sp.]
MNKLSIQIRNEFLKFFNYKGCNIVESDSLVPSKDRTLFFTSAGMVQFKRCFLGQVNDFSKKVVSCQKCFRTSDIDKVGTTMRHLTFFEMLGNFSFGDYFKEESIIWAWEFLTKNMSLSKNKLHVTVYKNDDESVEIWKKIVPSNKIIRMNRETNFWSIGDNGPCGPCSEILVDLGSDVGCGKDSCSPMCDCGRYLELWNLVFTQFNNVNGFLENLPNKNIDTGMGLERIAAVINGKKNVFETDLFLPIINAAADILKIKNKDKDISKLRIIADHSRAATFLISDGVLPSNDGRGYVLRRILRKAQKYGSLCGCDSPFINMLASFVVEIMKSTYPDLSLKLNNIKLIIKNDEEKFLETIKSGSKMIYDIVKFYKSKKINNIDGKTVFKLYDTYGFPYDLTKEIAIENGLTINENEFKNEQSIAQKKSRFTWNNDGPNEENIDFYLRLHEKIGDTSFVGYDSYKSNCKVLSIVVNGKIVSELVSGNSGEIILSNSSFYAFSGGQIADEGKIINDCFESIVDDVFSPVDNLFVHKIKVLKGKLKVGDIVSTIVNTEYRKQISRHHTATHLLHKVLREIFGTHVVQSGSLVTSKYLRFDFTNFCDIKKNHLIAIEKKINHILRLNLHVCSEVMNIEDAKNLDAVALFDEKYKNKVRVVSIKDENEKCNYSIELCCGTHVKKTGEIGIFKITSGFSIASNVKRIEAVVGSAAEDYIFENEEILKETSKLLNVQNKNIVNKIFKYTVDYKKLENEISLLKNELMSYEIGLYIKKIRKIGEINFLSTFVTNTNMKLLRLLSNKLKNRLKSIVGLLVVKDMNKVFFVTFVTEDYLIKGIDASKIAAVFADGINGSSGGSKDFARGGSKGMLHVNNAMENVYKYICRLNDAI